MGVLKHSLIERLVRYLHVLGERQAGSDRRHFSSAEIAALIHVDDTQVRKDLAAIGVRGVPRLGFDVEGARSRIRETLGFDHEHRAVLLGAGHLGGALVAYEGFAKYGLRWVGIFDQDERKQGQRFGRLVVQPPSRLKVATRQRAVDLAVIAVPVAAAQRVAELAVAAGIEALWNFAPTSLVVPARVFVRNEHISVGLGEVAYHLRQRGERRVGID